MSGIRDTIREIVREEIAAIGGDLKSVVRQVLFEELSVQDQPPPAEPPAPRQPQGGRQRQSGPRPYGRVRLGQRWRGKESCAKIRGRTIEIVSLDKTHVTPVVVDGAENSKAKRIKYGVLVKSYELVGGVL